MNCRLDFPDLELVCCFCAMNTHEGIEHPAKMLIRLNYEMQLSHARLTPAKAN